MNKTDFYKRLGEQVMVVDGAMGTLLQSHMPEEVCPELANLEKPELVRDAHIRYIEAGADIINTNTFGGTRLKLDSFGLGNRVRAVNAGAARIAREAAAGRSLVAGNIGPTGRLVEPMGDLAFDEAYQVFREQAEALLEGGVDLFNLETFADLKEIKIAILAIRDCSDLPVMAAMTFEDTFQTFTGTSPEAAAVVLTGMDVDVVGVNCSTGPEPMLEVAGRLLMSTDKPVFAEPNAGIPRLDRHGTTFLISPEAMAEAGSRFVDIGVTIVGSCCGSTPEYTGKLKNAVRNRKPLSRTPENMLRLSSRTHVVSIGQDLPFAVIGERINPTNREDLQSGLAGGRISVFQDEARKQTGEGAHLLDVNIGMPSIDETAMMARIIRGIENVVRAPLVIDSTHAGAMEAALKETPGKPLLNSVHGSRESMESVLPLAKKYGAGLLCLAVGEKGIPKTAEERLEVLRTIIREAEAMGISRRHLICDCLTLTVSAEQKRAETTLRAVRMVREELGLPAVLGVSNISFGLPERSLINAAFLSMAMASGLDAAIINPGDTRMMETVRAASVLTVRDRDSRQFVADHRKKKGGSKDLSAGPAPDSPAKRISEAVMSGNRDEIADLVQTALNRGHAPLEINNDMLIPAIQEVGRLYDRKELYLPQMILAAETMQRGFAVLEPLFAGHDNRHAGTVVLCTVKGDVHDIGKNIVGLFLKNYGFRVVDLGKDVPADVIVRSVLEEKADIVGLSALMTTTMVEMPRIIDTLKEAGSPAKTIVGGAVVTKAYAREIGADGYADDGISAVELVTGLLAVKETV